MPRGVRILNVAGISLPPLPEKPLPMKLSLFDALWIGFPPIQRLMLYSSPNTELSFPSLLEFLKSSLSATLPDYLPLAGKLTHVPSTGDVEIDFSDLNVTFLEAESDLYLHQLATDEIHDVESFAKLVPAIDVGVLPFPVFSVQVTRFEGNGVAIGYTVHHTVVDGKALLQFVEAWTVRCRAKMNGFDLPIKSRSPLLYDRSVIKHPKGEEIARKFLRIMAHDLPVTSSSVVSTLKEDRIRPFRQTFTLGSLSIQFLKQRATQHEYINSASRSPTTFSAISAHVWTCIVRAKSFDPNEEMVFFFLMDCRARINPPINDDYFGPCVRGVLARAPAGELTGEDGLTNACAAIRKSIDDVPNDALSDCENWMGELPWDRLVNATASPKFRVYEADFGFGQPDRFESVSMNRAGEFALVGGKGEGTVQVSVSLDPNQMDTFAKSFFEGLN